MEAEVLSLTESRIEHVKRHLVAFSCSCDRDQSFVAVVLRLVDFDDTATEMTNFIDFSTTLADDCSNHVVRDVDLLRNWLAGH